MRAIRLILLSCIVKCKLWISCCHYHILSAVRKSNRYRIRRISGKTIIGKKYLRLPFKLTKILQLLKKQLQFEDNPLNLNSASAEELHRIPAVSNLIASRIIDRRNRKRFTSVNELLEVDGITPEVLAFIRRFVRIGRMKEESNFSASFLSRISTEIEDRQGFVNGAYPGSPEKVLNRLHLSFGNDYFAIIICNFRDGSRCAYGKRSR